MNMREVLDFSFSRGIAGGGRMQLAAVIWSWL